MNFDLEFPEESVKKARNIAEIYKKREKSKKILASNLYDGHFLEINYGFDESLKNGNCGPYFHEILKDSECFTKAAIYYLLARELDLDPKFYWASDMQDLSEGEKLNDKAPVDHSFISVKIGKGLEYVIDPFMGAFGKMNFSKTNNEVLIYNKNRKDLKKRRYSALIEFSQEDIIKKIEQNRSPGGGRTALSGTQKIKSNGNWVYANFNQESSILFTKLNFSLSVTHDEPYQKSDVYKLETKVNEDGTFNFLEGNFVFYYSGACGWSNNLDEQEPFIIPVYQAEIASNLFEKIIKEGKKIKKFRWGTRRLGVELKRLGLNYNFRPEKNSISELIINEEFKNKIESLKDSQNDSVNDFMKRAIKDNISWRTFLRDAQYNKAKEERVSKDNEFGYVYSHEDHERLILEKFEGFKDGVNLWRDEMIDNMRVKAGLDKGSDYLADRKSNIVHNKFIRDLNFFNDLVTLRKIRKEPYAYGFKADKILFFRDFDIANDSIEKLEKGLEEIDLINAGKMELFNALLLFTTRRNALSLKQYHSGLTRILNKTRN